MKNNKSKNSKEIIVISSYITLSLIILTLLIVTAVTIQLRQVGTGTNNVTTESSNNSHLDISDQAPYNNLVAYWSFDADNNKGGKI